MHRCVYSILNVHVSGIAVFASSTFLLKESGSFMSYPCITGDLWEKSLGLRAARCGLSNVWL